MCNVRMSYQTPAGRRRVWWRMAGLGWSTGDVQEWAPWLTKEDDQDDRSSKLLKTVMSSCSCHREVGPKVCWDALPQTQLDKKWSHQTRAGFSIQCLLCISSHVSFLATFWSQLLVTFFFCRGSWSKVSFNWIHLVKSFMKGWNASWPGTLAASRIDRPKWRSWWSWEPFEASRAVFYLEVEVLIGNPHRLAWQTPSAACRPSGLQMNSGDEENALADMGWKFAK